MKNTSIHHEITSIVQPAEPAEPAELIKDVARGVTPRIAMLWPGRSHHHAADDHPKTRLQTRGLRESLRKQVRTSQGPVESGGSLMVWKVWTVTIFSTKKKDYL